MMKSLFLVFLTLSSFLFCAMKPGTNPQEYLDFANAEHFSPIGQIEIRSEDGSVSDFSTGTLIKSSACERGSKYVLTAAHNFDGVNELGKENMFFYHSGNKYRIMNFIINPHFRNGGADLAVAILEKSIDAPLATLGSISNEKLSQGIWDGIPSFEEDQAGRGENKRYLFSTAGFGRFGFWDQDSKTFQRDSYKRGYNLCLESSLTYYSSYQFPIPEVIYKYYGSSDIKLSGGATIGSSGSPVFIMNKQKPGKWLVIGVLKSGKKTNSGWTSLVTPINQNKWLDDVLLKKMD